MTYDEFKAAFATICGSHGGEFYQPGMIYPDDSSYKLATKYGDLLATIHEAKPRSKGNRMKLQFVGIYLRFHTYTGPLPFPLPGPFNRYSYKWNISVVGADMTENYNIALRELEHRLGQLHIHTKEEAA